MLRLLENVYWINQKDVIMAYISVIGDKNIIYLQTDVAHSTTVNKIFHATNNRNEGSYYILLSTQ
jgi:hypothetical protein